MIMHLVAALVGLVLLTSFLGILVWWLKELPLIIIMVTVVLLLLHDVVQTLRYGEGWAERNK